MAQQLNVGFQSGLSLGNLPQQIRPNGAIRVNGMAPLTVRNCGMTRYRLLVLFEFYAFIIR